jgi:hypothetical protein
VVRTFENCLINNSTQLNEAREELKRYLTKFEINVAGLNDEQLLSAAEELILNLEYDLNYNDENSEIKLDKLTPQILETNYLGECKYSLNDNQ